MSAILTWAFTPSSRYHDGLSIACETDDGGIEWADLERGASFAIVKKAKEPGATDMMLCGGIQSLQDAKRILAALQATATR